MPKDMQGSSRQDFQRFLSTITTYHTQQTPKTGLFNQKRRRDSPETQTGIDEFMRLIEASRGEQMSFLALSAHDQRIIGTFGDVSQRLGYPDETPLMGTVLGSLCVWPDTETQTGGTQRTAAAAKIDGMCFHADLPILHSDGHAVFFDVVRIPLAFLQIPVDLLIMKEVDSRTTERAQLHERVKELKCLYAVSEVTRYSEMQIEMVLKRVVECIPSGFQYPVTTSCSIVWDEHTYTSEQYRGETAWQLEEELPVLNTEKTGSIAVQYFKDYPEADIGPFLNEEKELLVAVASLIGNFLTQRLSEAAMIFEKNQIRSLFSGIDDIIYVSDPDTYELLYVNDSGRAIWGEEIVGKKCHKALQGRDEPCPFCTNPLIMGDFYGKSYVWEFQNEVNKRWYRCSDKAIRWSDGRTVRFEIAGDITWQKDAEKRQEEMTELLLRSNQELEQFAYVASHDLQEPLRMVSSYTQLLSQRYGEHLDEKAHSYINYAVDGAIRMQQLINDLLEFSRVTTRGRDFVPTDSHAMLGRVIVNLGKLIEEEQALITNDDLPIVTADPMQLTQLLQNLIANAIKFHDDNDPRVHVSVEQDEDPGFWRFGVHDNGIGIDPEYQEKVFIIFQRLHSRKEYPGSGIGLALCKKIVERHGGRIWFETNTGGDETGTTFYFTMKKG